MADAQPQSATSEAAKKAQSKAEDHRLFLVVVDDTPELPAAIDYACQRARKTGGRVALLYVYYVDNEFHHFKFVTERADQEARREAEDVIRLHALRVMQETGRTPDTYVRHGARRTELFKLVKEHPEISILILSAAPGKKPGPLIDAVTGKYAGKIGIPVTIVPGLPQVAAA